MANEIFDESHYFMCTNGLKPAQMKSNQKVMHRVDGKYYLTNMSLRCKGVDFSCRWVALMYAIIAAAMALLMASGVGAILLIAIIGAAVGACVGAALCGDMAAIMRVWIIMKVDLTIEEYKAVSNKSQPQLSCAIFGGQINFVPNVTNVFDEYFIFAQNTLGVGLEGFMYAYGFRGVGLLLSAPKAFLSNFASNYLKSWATAGIIGRGVFSAMAGSNAYYQSSEQGFHGDDVLSAVGKTFFFEAAVAEGIHDAITSNEGNQLLKTLGIAKSIAPIFAIGGIPGGSGGDATKADVVKATKETVPGKIAKKINEWKAASKEHQVKLEGQGRGEGAGECGVKSTLNDAPADIEFKGKRPSSPEYKVVDANGNLTKYGKWYYERPAWQKQTVEDVWNGAKNEEGKVIDRLTENEITWDLHKYRGEQWHMGHKEGYEFSKHQQSAAQREIGVEQFRKEHNTPNKIQPELPASNLSHKGEAPKNIYFGD